MQKKILLVVGVFFLTGFTGIFGQTLKKFTREPQVFFEEITGILLNADKKEGKRIQEEVFGPVWNNPASFSREEREKIYGISDGMLSKRMRPFPDFESFIESLLIFSKTKDKESFNAWLVAMELLSNGKKKQDFVDFLAVSHGLANSNTFYESSHTKWQSSNNDFTFEVRDGEPVIIFSDMNLRCYSRGDSAVIYSTGGEYFPSEEVFRGREGKLTWERAGLDQNETFAIIQNNYQISTRSTSFTIDSVLFYNAFFSYPLLGMVSEKILANVDEESASYPRFESYDKRLKIKNIVDKVDYEGGFSMRGASLQGYGTFEEPARLTFFREGFPFLVSSARAYTIEPKQISAAGAQVLFFLDNDSVTHPSLQLKFQRDQRLLTLIRTEEGISKSPYFDSYHKLDLYFEALYWKIDDPVIEMGSLFGSSDTRAAFESSSYFKKQRYEALQGMDPMHPLFRIREYARKINADEFEAEGLAADMRYPLGQIIPMLIDLSNKGFLSFNIERKWISLNPKLNDYILARAGKIDYDVILFNSETPDGKNASLNLVNYDLVLNGVERIIMSDSQQVAVFPSGKTVTVRKNRDFSCGGVIHAGKLQFFGKEYGFNYDKFQFDLLNVDSCRIYVDSFEETPGGGRRMVRVKNVIEGVRGVLHIDNPFNKSGLQEEFTHYPVFDCDKNSFVYYDNSRIQKGVYNRNRFFFELEPFVIDSLDNFNTDQIGFHGTLNSGGIFPDLAEELKVQEDYSLGFVRSTPAEGLPLYQNKAVFTNDIVLNYNGLQGNGDLEFITSTSTSENFFFFPDSTNGITTAFVNKEKPRDPEIPQADAGEISVQLLPDQNQLIAEVLKAPINMFNNQATLDSGSVVLADNGLIGSGIMHFEEAKMSSREFNYHRVTFTSDTANFQLASLTESNMAFKTDNVNAFVDFENRVGDFKSNGDETVIEFPVNQYICYMDQFKWFMDKNDIALESSRSIAQDFVIDTELDLSRSNFVSVNEAQDSLNFMAPKAVFDLDDNVLTCGDIPWIRVADARITPDSGKVIIRRRAKMDPLINASILANYVTQYHNIYEASVNIQARNDYNATGKYNYLDENKKPQLITFGSIAVDSSLQTYASGVIAEQDNFMLSPHFEFIGKTKMEANIKTLTFEGSTRILHSCDALERNWMNFKAPVDPEEVMIPVDTILVDNRQQPVEAGIVLANDPYRLYGTFLSSKDDENDHPLVTSRGFLYFDKKSQRYEIASKEKLREKSLPGNYTSLDKSNCTVFSEGELELTSGMGQVKFKTFGEAHYNGTEERLSSKMSVLIDFFFNDDAMKKMEEQINVFPDLKPVDISKTMFEKSIRNLMGLEESDKIISELSLSGQIKRLPDEMTSSLFIADVSMEWDPVNESFVSTGPIGIASIGKKQVFRYVKGKIEIEKRATGDELYIFLELDDENWYYFNYNRGLMQAFSSDQSFNDVIMETKEDKRKKSGSKDEDNYSYMLSSRKKASDFRDR